MLYYGYFRDLNTDIDPKGQLYKVEIITDLENPYPYYGDIENPIPSDGVELTMCSQPFTVSYEGENNNIYKPHKCSTATIRFLMTTFNSDIFATYNKKVLVSLLKWKNNIKLDGDYYKDENDNIICSKHSYQISPTEIIYKFIPEEVDKLCYDVEWIGFATPNCYNQNYSLIEQEFEYEVQDALSTLEDKKWEINYELEVNNIITAINRIIGSLGVYSHIYTQNTVRTDISSDISHIDIQWRNWEDKNYLEILDGICEYLNLTIVPFKDSIYIIDYDGVAGEHQYFIDRETTGNTRYYFNYNDTWINRGLKLVGNTIRLGASNYCSNDTNISLEEVIDGVELSTDSKEINLLPNTLEDKNYKYYTVINTPPQQIFYEQVSRTLGAIYTNKVIFNKGVFIQLQDYTINEGVNTFIYDNDTLVQDGSRWLVMRNTIPVDYPTFQLNYLQNKVGCVLLQNAKLTKECTKLNTIPTRQDISKEIVIYPNTFVFFGETHYPDTTNYSQWWWNNNQPVLSFNTPKFIFNKRKELQIKGDWTFFRNNALSFFEQTDNNRPGVGGDNLDVHVEKKYLYITCSVELEVTTTTGTTTYTLRKDNPYNYNDNHDITTAYSYYWDSGYSPYRCDLYLSDENIDINKPFGQIFNFGDKEKGFIKEFPSIGADDNAICKLNITIYRPLGCGVRSDDVEVFANSSKLENFEVNIIDAFEDINYEEITYKTKGDNLLELESSLISQPYFKDSDWGFTTMATTGYKNTRLYKVSTSLTDIPEKLRIADYYNQYTNQTLRLNTSIFKLDNLTPATCIKTNQFAGYNFVIDTQEIDYELNTTKLSLVRKHKANSIPELDIEKWIDNGNGLEPVYNPLWFDTTPIPYPLSTFSLESDSAIYSTQPERIVFEPYFTDEGIIARVSNGEDDVVVNVNNNNELIITN